MPIAVACPTCGSKLSAPDKLAGKWAKCPKCGDSVAIIAPADRQPKTNLPKALLTASNDDPFATARAAPKTGLRSAGGMGKLGFIARIVSVEGFVVGLVLIALVIVWIGASSKKTFSPKVDEHQDEKSRAAASPRVDGSPAPRGERQPDARAQAVPPTEHEAPPARPDHERIQGTWLWEQGPFGVERWSFKGGRLVVEGRLKSSVPGSENWNKYRFELNEKSSPKQINLYSEASSTNIWAGVYAVSDDGNVLTINISILGIEYRPKSLDEKIDSGLIMVFEKQ